MTRPPPSGPDDFDPTRPEHWPAPPEPTAAGWAKARAGIAARLARRAAGRRWAGRATASGLIAAGVLAVWGVWTATGPTTPPAVPPAAVADAGPTDPLAGYDVLPIATASDVMVSAVRGGEVRFGSIDHPVPEVMPLPTAGEVVVLRGPTAGELCVPEPGGMTMYVMPEK